MICTLDTYTIRDLEGRFSAWWVWKIDCFRLNWDAQPIVTDKPPDNIPAMFSTADEAKKWAAKHRLKTPDDF